MKTAPSTRSGWAAAGTAGPGAPAGRSARDPRAPRGPGRQRNHRRACDARRVHHRDRVRRELALGVRLDGSRTIRAPVAAAVEREHAEVTRQVRDLRLPVARVDDRPGREQQHGRLAGAVALPEETDALALDVALFVRVRGAGLLSFGRHVLLEIPP